VPALNSLAGATPEGPNLVGVRGEEGPRERRGPTAIHAEEIAGLARDGTATVMFGGDLGALSLEMALPIVGVTGFGERPELDRGAFEPFTVAIGADLLDMSWALELGTSGGPPALTAARELELGLATVAAELALPLDLSGAELVATVAADLGPVTPFIELATELAAETSAELSLGFDVALGGGHRLHASAASDLDELRVGAAWELAFE